MRKHRSSVQTLLRKNESISNQGKPVISDLRFGLSQIEDITRASASRPRQKRLLRAGNCRPAEGRTVSASKAKRCASTRKLCSACRVCGCACVYVRSADTREISRVARLLYDANGARQVHSWGGLKRGEN